MARQRGGIFGGRRGDIVKMMRMRVRIDPFVKHDRLPVEKMLQRVIILRLAQMHYPRQPD